mmetsp:Transcript_111989/g.317443  ORF Transcript_111989/g.317443 Transcript_111989/m.317443 type:complete len:210 (-) Transcript_111989:2359-2988(-)
MALCFISPTFSRRSEAASCADRFSPGRAWTRGGGPGGRPTPFCAALRLTSLPWERFRTSASELSTMTLPLRKTATSLSLLGSTSAPATVFQAPCSWIRARRPALAAPLAQPFWPAGWPQERSLLWPQVLTYEHLMAHFRASYCALWRPPPPPKQTLSAAQPFRFMASRISTIVFKSTPSFCCTRRKSGSSLWPVPVVVDPNLPSSFSST